MGDELKAEVSAPDSSSSNGDVAASTSGPAGGASPPRKPPQRAPAPDEEAEGTGEAGEGRRRSLIPRPEGYKPRSSAPPAKPPISKLRRASDPELAQLLGIDPSEVSGSSPAPSAPGGASAAVAGPSTSPPVARPPAPPTTGALMPMKIIGISAPASPQPEPAPPRRAPSPSAPPLPLPESIPAADLDDFAVAPSVDAADPTLQDLEPPEPEAVLPPRRSGPPSRPQNEPPPLPVAESSSAPLEVPPVPPRPRPSDPSAPPPLPKPAASAPIADAATPPETPAVRLEVEAPLEADLPAGPVEEVELEEVAHDEGEPIDLRAPRRGPPKLPSEADTDVEVTIDAPGPSEERASLRPPPPKRRLPKAPPPRVSFTGALDEDESGKRKPWWEEVFSDDFLRADFELTDAQVADEVRFIEESLGVEPGGVILDLACGSGRHAIELAKHGYTAVGYDLSVSQLARASERAQAAGVQVSFLQGDMRDMAFEQMFDGVVCWNASFGYFEEEKNIAVLRNAFRALKPGGSFLLDIPNRDFVVSQQPSQNWFEGEACVCMDDMHVDFITSRLCVKRTLMLDDGRNRECLYSLRLYALHELGRMLHDVGFRVSEVTGHLAMRGVFMGATSPRLILLVVKP